MARAVLRICFKGSEQKRHTLTEKKTVVGREKKCGIVVDNQSVSGRHFELVNEGDLHWVRDLGSANGTFVNGQRIDSVCLRHLDEIVVGKYTLVYENTRASAKSLAERPLPKVAEEEKPADVQSTDDRKASRSTYVMDHAAVQAYVSKMAGTGRTATASGFRRTKEKKEDTAAAKARSEVSSLRRMTWLLIAVVVALGGVVAYLLYLQMS